MFPILFSLHDAIDPPCLHFDLRLSTLTSQFQTSTLTSYIVADMVGTPQLDL